LVRSPFWSCSSKFEASTSSVSASVLVLLSALSAGGGPPLGRLPGGGPAGPFGGGVPAAPWTPLVVDVMFMLR
jgi:hypothetical protein